MNVKPKRYLPALGFDFLTPLYDPLVRLTTREVAFKTGLLDQAQVNNRARVLDVGCGTGTLVLLLKARSPSVNPVGLDGDCRILAIARSKATRGGRQLDFVQAFSCAMPFQDSSFDRVLSSLMLHHLTRAEKVATLREMFRVLRPGGELHVADWGRPHNILMTALSLTVRIGDGVARTADNIQGRLPDLFREAGFEGVSQTRRFATVFGTLQLYRARRPRPQEGEHAA